MRLLVILGLSFALALCLVASRRALDEAWRACARWEATSKTEAFPQISGSLVPRGNGRWELRGPTLSTAGPPVPLSAEVFLSEALVGSAPGAGREVTVSGPLRCQLPRRNPGRLSDGLLLFQFPRARIASGKARVRLTATAASLDARAAIAFDAWIAAPLSSFPGVRGLVRAIWTGDTAGLPDSLVGYYREGGLLPVLALSGQHVAVLALVLRFLFRRAMRPFCGPRTPRAIFTLYREGQRALSVLCAALLYVTSGAAPSMRRTLAMSVAGFALKARGLASSRLQITGSSVAVAVALDPSLVASPGFFLSAAATGLLVQVAAEADPKRQIREYVFITVTMSLLTLPLSAFFFTEVAWSAPLTHLALGVVWSWFLMPLGFLLPFAVRLLPQGTAAGILGALEAGWRALVRAHEASEAWVAAVYRPALRPTWLELAVLEGCLLALVLALRHKLSRGDSFGRQSPSTRLPI